MPRRLLVIGCESADWSAIHPLTEAGTMPNLHRLIEGGASGVLTGLPPLQRDMLWTSVATGCRARRHGVTGPTELRPDGGGIQPAGHRSWRAPAFWEILASAGIRTTVVNWPTTRPGRRWAADVIDDSFAQAHGKDFDDWPLPPDCAPQVLRATLRGLRIHPGDIAASEIAAFVPDLRAVDQATDPSLAQLAHILAESASVHAAATHLVAESPWQVLAVHYRLIDHTQRAFLQFKSDPAADPMAARPYGGVVDAAYRFQDMLIGRLLDLCGPDTDVLIVSPNGMSQSVEESTRPMPRAEGILVAHGPSTARDRIVHGATMFDIAPTILALFGLASESDGRVLHDVLASTPSLRPVPAPVAASPSRSDAAPVLEELGYRDTLSPAQQRAMRGSEASALANLAESEIAAGSYRAAADLLRRALAIRPDHVQTLLLLAHCQVLMGDWESCMPLAEALLARHAEGPWGNLLKGALHALAGDIAAAEPYLAKAREQGRESPLAQLQLGLLAVRLHDYGAAEQHFRGALCEKSDLVEALNGLAIACRAQGKLAEAEASLRQAIALRYHFPHVHFQLGLLLLDSGRVAEAMHELRTALQQDPAFPGAEAALQRIVRAQIRRADGPN